MSSSSSLKLKLDYKSQQQQFFIQNKPLLDNAKKEVTAFLNSKTTKTSNYKKRLLEKYTKEMQQIRPLIKTMILTEKQSDDQLLKNNTNTQFFPKSLSPQPIDKHEIEIRRYLTCPNTDKYEMPSPDSVSSVESFFQNKYEKYRNLPIDKIIEDLNK